MCVWVGVTVCVCGCVTVSVCVGMTVCVCVGVTVNVCVGVTASMCVWVGLTVLYVRVCVLLWLLVFMLVKHVFDSSFIFSLCIGFRPIFRGSCYGNEGCGPLIQLLASDWLVALPVRVCGGVATLANELVCLLPTKTNQYA